METYEPAGLGRNRTGFTAYLKGMETLTRRFLAGTVSRFTAYLKGMETAFYQRRQRGARNRSQPT